MIRPSKPLVTAIMVMSAILYKVIDPRLSSGSSNSDGPIISSADMLGTIGLQSLVQGTMGTYAYNLLTNESGRVMVLVTPDRNTTSHIGGN